MRNFLILMIFALLTSCRMKLDDNFFEVQEDTVSGFVEYDSYGFDKDPLMTSFYVRGDFIDVYYLNAPAKSFHIEDIDAKKNRVHYTLSGGSDFYRNYIAIFSDGDIFTGGPDLGLNRYFTSNAKTLSSPPDAMRRPIYDYS